MENKKFIGFENIEIPYKEYINSSNKKHIVFLHGLFENIEIYNELAEYFFNAGYNIYLLELRNHGILQEKEVIDFGTARIEGVIKDVNLFITQKLLNVNYKDIILFGQGIGALIAYYLSIDSSFKNLIISSMLLERKLTVSANLLRSSAEMKLNIEKSTLNSYFKQSDKKYPKEHISAYMTSDKTIQNKLKNYNFTRIASPSLFNDLFRLMKYVKKNVKNIREDANLLVIYGGEDKFMLEDRIKKYMTFINNKLRKIKIIKNEKGRFNSLLEKNRLDIYKEIEHWLNKID